MGDERISSIFIDESGAKNTRGGSFVVGFLKTSSPAVLSREIRDLRQRNQYYDEIKFSSINGSNVRFYFDIVEAIGAANLRVGGSVYDASLGFVDGVDSRAVDLVQLADVVASSINYLRTHEEVVNQKKVPVKRQVALRLARALGLSDFSDVREGKVNILTMQRPCVGDSTLF